MQWLPDTFLGWTSLVTVIIVGIIAVIGIFDRATRNRKAEAREAESRLVKALQSELNLLRQKMNEQDAKIEKMKQHLEALSSENKILKDVVKGKDQKTLDYQAKAKVSMKQIAEVHHNVERLYRAIEKHLGHIEDYEAQIKKKL